MTLPLTMTSATPSGTCFPTVTVTRLLYAFSSVCAYSVDCVSLKPLYKGTLLLKCAFCAASYAPEHKGKVCVVCKVASIGVDTVGLVTQSSTARNK
ncbi:hypothetical protein EON64_20090 [archaeon]|nr:MAG: hypothetical protein EON64_20090 [archaeon]